ncbi:MAG TPA: glyoxalase/bleomycin resistance/dioxygenase family protein, partial [Rhizomicrobium sp.]|nr:glyoxalase/bleomycin resistance/dioxygenase family protein [Rhizomicrobium sp.]
AQSNKAWVDDPSGVRWETFFTFGDATTYGEDEPRVAEAKTQACCAPSAPKAASGCGTANSTCC